jgi:hypothetical protein
VLAILAACFLAPALAAAQESVDGQGTPADPPGRVGRVAEVTGTVRTVDADGHWTALQRNQPLTTGDQVFSDVGGRAVLQIGSSTVRVGENSGITFTRLDDAQVRLHFDHGALALRVRSSEVADEIAVEADEGDFLPQRPGYFRFDREPGKTLRAMSWSGEMLLQAHDSALPIAADQRAEIWQEGEQHTTHYRLLAIPTDDFADWALAEDRAEDRMLADTSAGAAIPTEMTGAAELAQYGNWATTTDYGSVWYPSQVYAGWAPYTYGYWNWVGPWGWTWIDYAPWGFAPFHYGRWVWIGGRWAWCPGYWGARPMYAPGLVGWVGGAGFVVGGRPMVGWVPLAPNEPYYPGYPFSMQYWNSLNGNLPGARRPLPPIAGRPRAMPPGPATYANRSVQGAVSIAAAQALGSRQPIPAQRPPAQASLLEAIVAGRAQMQAPPAPPPGRSFGARPVAPFGAGRPGAAGAHPPGQGPAPAAPVAPAAHGMPAGGRPHGAQAAQAVPGAQAAQTGQGAQGTQTARAVQTAQAARTAQAAHANTAATPPAPGHHPAPAGGPLVVFSAPTTVPQPVPLAAPNAPVPLAAPHAPVPLQSPNAPVPLQSSNAPVPLANAPQVRQGAPILVRLPIRSPSPSPTDPGTDDSGQQAGNRQGNGATPAAPALAAPPGAFGFAGGRAGGPIGGGMGGGIAGGARGGHQ